MSRPEHSGAVIDRGPDVAIAPLLTFFVMSEHSLSTWKRTIGLTYAEQWDQFGLTD